MELERSSGILLHITSLPSKYGIGDFGPEAFKFVDFLIENKQKLWQILPLTITNSPSPYSSISSFGGNPWLISPDILLENNLLSKDDLNIIDQSLFNDDYVNFNAIKQFKINILKIAFQNFKNKYENFQEILNEFYQKEIYWIQYFILFMTIKDKYGECSWSDWPDELRRRNPIALEYIRRNENDRLQYHLFVQYIFYQQWNQLKKYANNLNIKIIGDIPMYLDYDSVDVWANSHLFKLDSNTFKPSVVSGFPASDDYDVQIWNQPVYNWEDENVKDDLFQWWIKRLSKTLSIVNILRIDHFRGFVSHYVISIDITTQQAQTSKGHWIKTPGYELFNAVTRSMGCSIPLIVEDIGDVTKEVFQLRDHFHFYGIRILQMGFYTYPDNIYSPHNYIPNSIVYTGGHDNPTAIEWWSKFASEKAKEQFIEYIRRPFSFKNELINGLQLEKHVEKHISWYLIQMVLQSSSNGAILLMQDLLNIQTRMNDPGMGSSIESSDPQNWSWRFKWSQLTLDIRNELEKLTRIYGRHLKYGKSIPPEDMIMKHDSSFFSK